MKAPTEADEHKGTCLGSFFTVMIVHGNWEGFSFSSITLLTLFFLETEENK